MRRLLAITKPDTILPVVDGNAMVTTDATTSQTLFARNKNGRPHLLQLTFLGFPYQSV